MRRPARTATPAPASAAAPIEAGRRLPAWLMAVLLVTATVALYWPATRGGYTSTDDDTYVATNLQVQKGLTWGNIKWAFLNPVLCNWHPMTVWSHMAACQVFGLNPWGHHLINVLLHALNTGLVFVLLRQMTGASWRSLFVAALFAVHPLRVEAAAWVAERKGVLSSFFGLLALIAYARYVEVRSLASKVQSPKAGLRGPWSLSRLPASIFYLLALLLLALGLMSKPMLVTWPCVMLLLDYWPLGRMQNAECGMRNKDGADTQPTTRNPQPASRFTFRLLLPLLVEKIPFLGLAVLQSVATWVVQRGPMAMGETLPLGARVANAMVSYCRYLGKLFWPANLIIYPHPMLLPAGKVWLAGCLLLGISTLVWLRRRTAPYLLLGWLWYCGTLVPASQIVQVGVAAMADRWSYVPSIGLLILIVWAAADLTRRWRHQVLSLSVAGAAAMLLFVPLTRRQISYWKDTETFARHAIEVPESSYIAHKYLGIILYEQGRVDEAVNQFRAGVRLKPDNADAHYDLGLALEKQGRMDEAISQFQEALRLEPDNAEPSPDLVVTFFQESRSLQAIRQLHVDLHYSLGSALYQRGRTAEAISQFQETLRLEPEHAEAHNCLGVALSRQGRTDEAIRQFREALRLKPDYPDARKNLDLLFARKAHGSPPAGAATKP